MGSWFSRLTTTTMLTLVPVAVTLVVMGVYKLENMLIYPSNYPVDSRYRVDTPEVYDIPYEDVSIETPDGVTIRAYVMTHPWSHPGYIPKTVLMLCPNAGNMGHSLPLASIFYEKMGYNVVIFSYRGYGKSTGKPSEKGLKIDVECILEYIGNHSVLKDSAVVLYGRSLGGAVAIHAATLDIGKRLIRGIVLENSFLSIVKLIPIVLPPIGPLAFLCRDKWLSEKSVLKVPESIPVLFLAGSQDELVPTSHMRELFRLAPSTDKIFKEFPKGTHNDTCIQPHYWSTIHDFIREKVEPVEDAPEVYDYGDFVF